MSEPLSSTEIAELLEDIALNISEIALWRIKIMRLKEEIKEQTISEDDIIFSDLYDFLRTAKDEELPLSRTYSINSKKLRVTVTHRHKAENIYGVDLVYEIIDEKIVLLQYKRAGGNRINIDRHQLKKLRELCYDKCIAKKYEDVEWFYEKFQIVAYCPCHYFLYIEPKEELILPACMVEAALNLKEAGRKSANVNEFYRGISRDSFIEAFSKCWVGAIYARKEIVDEMVEVLISDSHLLIHCEERGKQ